MTQPLTFAAVVSDARLVAGMTAAEMDYSLAMEQVGAGTGMAALRDAIDRLATRGLPEVKPGDVEGMCEVRQRARDEAHERFTPDIKAMVAAAKTKSYSGWSDASSGPIRYAEPKQCRCTGQAACQWEQRGSERVSVCVRCGGDR